jgi:hypothetical protein
VDSLFLSTPTFMTSKILMISMDCTQEGNMEKRPFYYFSSYQKKKKS